MVLVKHNIVRDYSFIPHIAYLFALHIIAPSIAHHFNFFCCQVEGLPRKNNYHGRWDVLFDQANDCLRKMLETATRRYKNYILDQVCVLSTLLSN